MFKVNPNTMQKALIELERDGLLYTDRTNGKYVTTNQKVITKFKKKVISTKINAFLKDMNDIGINNKDIIDYLKERDKNGIN